MIITSGSESEHVELNLQSQKHTLSKESWILTTRPFVRSRLNTQKESTQYHTTKDQSNFKSHRGRKLPTIHNTMEAIIANLAGQIEDQKLWVEDMKLAIDKYYEEPLDPMIPSTIDTFDTMTSIYSEACENLKHMRRSLEYAMYAAGRDLDPDQRQTPELYV